MKLINVYDIIYLILLIGDYGDMAEDAIREFNESEKKAVILALTSMYGSEFEVERVNFRKFDNSSVYNISSKDGCIDTSIEFGNKPTDSTETLNDILSYIYEIIHDASPSMENDSEFRQVLMDVLNTGIKYVRSPYSHSIFDYYDGEIHSGTIVKNVLKGCEDLKKIYVDASLINGEVQSLSYAMLLLADFLDEKTCVGMTDVHRKFSKYADEYMLSDEYLFTQGMDWISKPYEKEKNDSLEKTRARMATIALLSDKFNSILKTSPSTNYEVELFYVPEKSYRSDFTYFHSREGREEDTQNARHNLISKAKPLDIAYRLFGKNNEKMSVARENKLLSNIWNSLRSNDYCDLITQNKDILRCLADANMNNGVSIINAIILNLFTFDCFCLGNPILDESIKQLQADVKAHKKDAFTNALDRNYDIAIKHPEIVVEVLKDLGVNMRVLRDVHIDIIGLDDFFNM